MSDIDPPGDGLAPSATLPAEFRDSGSGAIRVPELMSALNEATALRAQHDERIKTLPDAPEGYRLELHLPETVKLPDGMKLNIDERDPRWPALRAFAHKHHLSQEAVNEIVAMEAQQQIDGRATGDAEFQAEIKTLGPQSRERISALETALAKHVTEPEYEAVRALTTSAAAVSGLEKILARISGAGQDAPPIRRADLPPEQRWYPNGAKQ